MCGAAAESILLAAAVSGRDEVDVLRRYNTAGGRGVIEALVFERASNYVKRTYPGFTGLINYWRDEAAHGRDSEIAEDEAITAITLLLRFAHLMDDAWDQLQANET